MGAIGMHRRKSPGANPAGGGKRGRRTDRPRLSSRAPVLPRAIECLPAYKAFRRGGFRAIAFAMTLITDSAALAEFCARQKGAEFIAVDTEFMRERTYW